MTSATYDDRLMLGADVFSKIVDEMPDGIIALDAHGTIVFCNPSVEEMFGYPQQELVGAPLEILLPDRFRHGHGRHLKGFLAGDADTAYMGSRKSHILGQRADGEELRLGATILRTYTENGPLMVAVLRDISERLSYQSELEKLANTDPLTGLYNRRAFTRFAEARLEEARSAPSPLSLLLFDIDHFKSINDRYGHDVGDQVICDFASVIASILQGDDIAARWGGEEFIVLMPGTELDRAVLMAEMVRRTTALLTFGMPLVEGLRLTASAGVVCCSDGEETLASLVKHADGALYASKAAGRNTVTALMPDWPAPAHFALDALVR